MDDNEKRRIVNSMARLANRRLENLSKMELPAPAMRPRQRYTVDMDTVIRTDGEKFLGAMRDETTGNWLFDGFSSEGKNSNQLSNEIKYMQMFFENKTSTVKGAKSYFIDMMSRIENINKKDVDLSSITYEQTVAYWEGYNKFLEGNLGTISAMGRQVADRLDSNSVQVHLFNVFRESGYTMTSDELYLAAQAYADEDYATRIR